MAFCTDPYSNDMYGMFAGGGLGSQVGNTQQAINDYARYRQQEKYVADFQAKTESQDAPPQQAEEFNPVLLLCED